MAYTVKKLCLLSGVSRRTLHYYDEIGLLKPSYRGGGDYRYYEEKQLLELQQILFFRKLGLSLDAIKRVMGRSDFDQLKALVSHRSVIEGRIEEDRQLLLTIEKTINHLKGKCKMKNEELYWGFDSSKQKGYEKVLIERLGESGRLHFEESKERTKDWTQSDYDRVKQASDEISVRFVALLDRKLPAADAQVQELVSEHHKWIEQFWSPDRKAYIDLGKLYMGEEFRAYYAQFHDGLGPFLAEAMRVYAEANLE